MAEESYNLVRSVELCGPLIPVLVTEDGRLIDGRHRLRVDSKWPKRVVDWVKNPTDLFIARFHANYCRRQMTDEEISSGLGFLKTEANMNVPKIAQLLGMSEAWVRKHLPDEVKDERFVEGGKKGAIQRIALSQDIRQEDMEFKTAQRYYPLNLVDHIWEAVSAPARRLPMCQKFVEVMFDYCRGAGVVQDILIKAAKEA